MKYKQSLLIISLITVFGTSYAEPNKTINAIAFFGLLDDPRITKVIENKCNVKFSHDVYYTNSEFLTAFNQHRNDYDVMIFSNIAYGSVKDQLPKFDSNIWKVSNGYYPYFKNYYKTHNYAHNVAFFTHAMVGFLYNPAVINITPNQSIFDIFNNAKTNDVILVDDSGEIGSLLTTAYKDKYKINSQTKLTYDNLKKLTQDSHVYITSDFNKVYDNPKFAFAYMWSGDALLYIKKSHKPYKFIMPTNATSVCTDLLVQMKDTPEAKCVADVLASPLMSKYMEDDTYYFSPYFKNEINDNSYVTIYNQAKDNLQYYNMIPPAYDFQNYYNSDWDDIKLKFIDSNW